jgi:CubicO group peptidase (beta-lactamase class C family)
MRSLPAVKFFVAVVVLGALVVPALSDPREISDHLEKIRDKHQIPALTAAVVVEGRIVAIGATGSRSVDAPTPVTDSDLWHIGSCTKSMTASVVAMLVEDGTLGWESTIADILPEIPMKDAWRDVTVAQLLLQRGGAPHEPPRHLWKVACEQIGTPTEQRLAFVRGILADEPEKPPGTKWIYSDAGYSIVGAIMERATGQAWEDLMRERLFLPLGMMTAGFGAPATPGQVDEPWGHLGDEAPFKAVPPGPTADNPPAIGPAGTVHCSISDLARYTAWHVAGERGEGWLLSYESFHKLHHPGDGQTYGMGWCLLQRRWAGGTALMHTGENNMFYAVMWLGPGADTSFVAATNCDGYDARDACDEAIRYLINEF